MLDFLVSKAILVILSTDCFDVFIGSFLYCFRFTILDSLNVRLKLRHERIKLLQLHWNVDLMSLQIHLLIDLIELKHDIVVHEIKLFLA